MASVKTLISLITIVLISGCAATTPSESPSNNEESCKVAQEKLAAMTNESAKKSTLQAYYNKRCT
jgi:uncharacterized protein YceK